MSAFIYLRLSRSEEETPGLLEEKFRRHLATAHELAARYNLHVPEDNILIEQESGWRLKNRPYLRKLLDLANAGICTHIISPARDRLDRLQDKRDQADLEDALYNGKVTLITLDGATTYNDDLDTIPEEFRALIARIEGKMYSKRIREANRQRLRKNERSGSFAPYGYKRNKEAVGGYDVIPAEYSVLEEIFRRTLAGASLRSVHRWLNEKAIPPPGVGRRKNAGLEWDFSTLYDLVHNPIYAGYNARRTAPIRGKGYRKMDPDDFVLAEGDPGQWPHPIELADWHKIRAKYAAYRNPAYPRTSLLASILVCPEGSLMRAAGAGRSYGCTCKETKHYCHRPHLDQAVSSAVISFIDKDLAGRLDKPIAPAKDKGQLYDQLNRAVRALNQSENDVRALVSDGERQRRLLGDELYESILLKSRREWERLKEETSDLRDRTEEPDASEALTYLSLLRERGAAWHWDQWDVSQRRAVVAVVIRRIVLGKRPRPGAFFKRAQIEWQPWVKDAGLTPSSLLEWVHGLAWTVS